MSLLLSTGLPRVTVDKVGLPKSIGCINAWETADVSLFVKVRFESLLRLKILLPVGPGKLQNLARTWHARGVESNLGSSIFTDIVTLYQGRYLRPATNTVVLLDAEVTIVGTRDVSRVQVALVMSQG